PSDTYPCVPGSGGGHTCVVKRTSWTDTAVPEACSISCVRLTSGERRSSCTSAIATCSLWIVENSWPNLHGDNFIANQGLEGFTFTGETIFDQGKPEGAPQVR